MSPTGKKLLIALQHGQHGTDVLAKAVPGLQMTIIEATLASHRRYGYVTAELMQGRYIYALTGKGREFVESRMESITPGKLHVNSMMADAVPSDFPRMPTPTRLQGVVS